MCEDLSIVTEKPKNLQLLSPVVFTDFKSIRLVATDMDGTLTSQGKFTPTVLQALSDLNASGILVLIVTGRSAGWVSAISSLMPIAGAIAENGGLFYSSLHLNPVFLTPIPNLVNHRQRLGEFFQQLQQQFPQIQESTDNQFRITDWTFEIGSLSSAELQTMNHLCQENGWEFTYSNVQCHIKPPGQDKAQGLLQVLREYFPAYSLTEVVTVGDSPNDESLFNQDYFPVSVGVANISKYTSQLQYQPSYLTITPEGEGFCELASYILTNKTLL